MLCAAVRLRSVVNIHGGALEAGLERLATNNDLGVFFRWGHANDVSYQRITFIFYLKERTHRVLQFLAA